MERVVVANVEADGERWKGKGAAAAAADVEMKGAVRGGSD